MLKLSNITKYYGHFCALDDLSLSISEGALYGFVGPNGAGKTTAIRIMTGIIYPDEGSVTIRGMGVADDPAAYKSMIGYVPDSFGIYNNIRLREYMQFFAACCGIDGMEADKRTERLLKYVGLEDKADHYVEALSKGMKQKLSLARALINDPPILIMDEPTSGLDPRTRYEFKQILGELSDKGKTIIISSHILSDISELCTDIAIIDQGSIVMSGRLMEVMKVVTAENPIVISMAGRMTQAIRFLKEDSSVRSMAIKGNDIMINFSGNSKAEAELLRRLVEAGLPVRSFSREKGSLESIFMQLTGHGEEHTVLSYDAAGTDNKERY
ncbi:MAG: ABC transporter ATP-binding protein [Clostridiales bacterium]|nr:ABC transporter ATP-binding protein [Clostridiales bacterium]